MKRIIVALLWFGTILSHASVLQGDQFFKEQKFDLAKSEYEASAQVGNAHAYYQLATIYLKGLGSTKQDVSKALVYFSLAAESNFSDAKETADILSSLMPVEHHKVHQELVEGVKKHFGKQVINEKYFPKLIVENLTKRVALGSGKLNFNDSDLFDVLDISENLEVEELLLQSPNFDGWVDFNMPISFQNYGVGGAPIVGLHGTLPTNGLIEFLVEPVGNLILDIEIGADGSIREIFPFKQTRISGTQTNMSNSIISQIAYYRLENIPLFEDRKVPYIVRYRGFSSGYTKNRMRHESPRLFYFYRRLARQLKTKTDVENRYKYAMALTYHPWLDQEEGELENRLQELAELGHPQAQFELGMHLYREQQNIEKAIHWISQAASYGLTEAEYRLGRLFIESPWVEKDEEKSVFWLAKAAEKEHAVATQQIAKVMLTGGDKTLNIERAKVFLDKINDVRADNPEYHFLRALSFVKQQQRSMPQALASIRKAITLGDNLNWDVTEWQQLLDNWTTGEVNIQDSPHL